MNVVGFDEIHMVGEARSLRRFMRAGSDTIQLAELLHLKEADIWSKLARAEQIKPGCLRVRS